MTLIPLYWLIISKKVNCDLMITVVVQILFGTTYLKKTQKTNKHTNKNVSCGRQNIKEMFFNWGKGEISWKSRWKCGQEECILTYNIYITLQILLGDFLSGPDIDLGIDIDTDIETWRDLYFGRFFIVYPFIPPYALNLKKFYYNAHFS